MRSIDALADRAGLKRELEAKGWLSISGVPAMDDEALVGFAESMSDAEGEKLLAWDFGKVMRMRLDPQAANYLFSAEPVPLHWDGAFFKEPRYLLFYCDAADGEGGETTFVDTEAVLAGVAAHRLAQWREVTLTYTTEKKAHYGGRFSTRLVRPHPYSGRDVLRFAEAVETEKNPVDLEIEGGGPGLYQELVALVTDPRYLKEFRWQAGDLVLVDNHRFLHGRRALGGNTGRSFRRIQIM